MIAPLSEKAAVFSAIDLTIVRQAGLATNPFARTSDRRGLQYLSYFEGKITDIDPSTSIIIPSVNRLLIQRL
jgi:hypothetical protein